MTVSPTYAPGLTGRSWRFVFDDDTTADVEIWYDTAGYAFLAGFTGSVDDLKMPVGWLWQRMQDVGKTVTDIIVYINPGPTLMPPPPMP